ncbi:hypothetical protein ACE193_21515 [Bernardetia sp. OM2101]|uniref:hypothetical protein n=1 Tax=Bernardetia sp. OM2101 TaxID=3344876 RepID=UPI0035CEC94D
MAISEQSIQVKCNIQSLHYRILEAIDFFCKEKNNEITYVEIDAALIEVLSKNRQYQIKGLVEKKEKEDIDKIKEEV